jgi:regulator of RNase E activity RraA
MDVSTELRDLVARSTTSAVCDVLMKRGLKLFMKQRIRPLDPNVKMAGPALTIERRPIATAPRSGGRSNAAMIEAVEGAPAGTVLVFNGDPDHEAALWGGLLAACGSRNGLGGVVADGPVRDPLEIVELKQPCFCTGSVPAGQAGILTLGEIGAPLMCGGIVVHPGDFVFGDSNGVVVIPQGQELDILREAAVVEQRDQEAARLILSGKSLTETMKALGRV